MTNTEKNVRLLVSIGASERYDVFIPAFIDQTILHMSPEETKKSAIFLQENGYISGVHVEDGKADWLQSRPMLTLKGHEYLQEDAKARDILSDWRNGIIRSVDQRITAYLFNNF